MNFAGTYNRKDRVGRFYSEEDAYFPCCKPGPNAKNHAYCVLPGQRITGPLVDGAMTRWYDGEAVEITMASGEQIAVTTNHPVLTQYGWIAAGLLKEGYDRVGRLGEDGVVRAVGPDHYQKPALIEDVLRAFARSPGVLAVTMPTTAEDFHGDGGGSKVHVVWTKRHLGDELAVPLDEVLEQRGLVVAANSPLPFLGLRSSAQLLERTDSALRCQKRMGSVLVDPLLTHTYVADLGGLRTTAEVDASSPQPQQYGVRIDSQAPPDHDWGFASKVCVDDLLVGQAEFTQAAGTYPAVQLHPSEAQPFGDGGLGDPVLPGQRSRRLPGTVPADNLLDWQVVTKIVRFHYVGQVFNLETSHGWFAVEGIVTHNCHNCLIKVGPLHHEQAVVSRLLPLLTDRLDEERGIWERGIHWQEAPCCLSCIEDLDHGISPTLRIAPLHARSRREQVVQWAVRQGKPMPRRRHVGGFVRLET